MTDDELVLDRGAQADRAFLVQSIVEAEKSSTDKLSYASIFGLSPEQVESVLDSILQEDFEGQELCVSGFLIARVGGTPAGAVCSWVEGASGMASSIIKGNLLQHYLPPGSIDFAQRHASLLDRLTLERERGALQLESVYVEPDFRGRGVAAKLISGHLDATRQQAPGLHKAQIMLIEDNRAALRVYERLGFHKVARRQVDDPRIEEFLPGGARILMELELG